MSLILDGDTGVSQVQNGVIVQADLASNVAGTGPAFSAYASAATSLSTGGYTKVLFQTEEYDTNSNFASSRFTPTVAGYYRLNWGVDLASSFTGRLFSLVYKNGVLIYYASPNLGGVTQFGTCGTAMFNANGTTDYFEVYCFQDSGLARNTSFRTVYDNIGTFFQGALVRAA